MGNVFKKKKNYKLYKLATSILTKTLEGVSEFPTKWLISTVIN